MFTARDLLAEACELHAAWQKRPLWHFCSAPFWSEAPGIDSTRSRRPLKVCPSELELLPKLNAQIESYVWEQRCFFHASISINETTTIQKPYSLVGLFFKTMVI